MFRTLRPASRLVQQTTSRNFVAASRVATSSGGNTTANNRYLLGLGAIAAASGIYWMSKSYHASNQPTKEADESPFSPKEFRGFPIKKITQYNHNTRIYTVELPEGQKSGLTTASFVLIKGVDKDGKEAVRPYTPISNNETDLGEIVFLIKEYPEGNVSRYLAQKKEGDDIDVKGPFQKLAYKANMKKEIGMIAGGTGITPMFQVLQTILNNPDDKTKVSLLFANVSEKDILLRETLTYLQEKHPEQFKVHYVLDHPEDPKWGNNKFGSVGYVNKELVSKVIPPPSNDVLVLFCGPPPMLNAVAGKKGENFTQGEVGGVLKDIGFTSEQVYKF